MKRNLNAIAKLLSCLLVIALLIICMSVTVPIRESTGETSSSILRVAIEGDINNLSPNDTTDENAVVITRSIFELLVIADESMNIYPSLATSWKITPDGDLIFNLRKDVKFHDGTNFDATAVKMTFDRMKSEKLIRWSRFAPTLKAVEIIDNYTVKMDLDGSPHAMLTLLATFGSIESPVNIRKYNRKEIGFHPVGTGPFKFVEWVPDQRIVLEANKEYWGGEPKVSKLFFKPVPDEQTRQAMVETGDLDAAFVPPYTDTDRLKSHPQLEVKELSSVYINFLVFNTVKKPFNDKRIRQAISYSIDRKAIVKALLFGKVPLAESYGGPSVKHISKYDIYPYSPEKAKSIFAELGWKIGKSGFLEKDGEVFKTAFVSPSGRYPMDRQIAEAIQAQLRKTGIDLKVIILDAAAFTKAVMGDRQAKQNAEFGMFLITQPMGPELGMAFYVFRKSSIPPGGANYAIYENSELEQYLDGAAREMDETKRGEHFKKFQDILYDEVPWLPIYVYRDYLVLRKGVKGVGRPHPSIKLAIGKEAQIER